MIRERGSSIVEMLVVLGLIGSMLGIAIMNMKELEDPLQTGASQLAAFIKQVRAEAISSTLAYTIKPASTSKIITVYAAKCSDTDTTSDTKVALELPNGAHLASTTWDLCFNSRGLPDGNIDIEMHDIGSQSKTVEVMLGGAVRIK